MMKSDHLTRKTHLKRHPAPKFAETIDLTVQPDSDCAQALADLGLAGPADIDALTAMPYGFAQGRDVLEWCALMAGESPTGKSLFRAAAGQGWSLGLADLKSGGFCLDTENNCILLDHFALSPAGLGRSSYFRNALLVTFFRALRDIWHEERCGAFETIFSPEDVLMLERVRAADCDTVTLLAAWELRGAGYADIWRHVIGSEEGDMALVFTRHLERDPAALFDGSALAYAFRQWFADENRVDSADHDTLETLDDLLSSTDARLGLDKCDGAFLETFSRLPDGISYLAGLGDTVRNDPFFSGLNDPINQTHLFHLVYDTRVVMVNNVPFRDAKLARLIFPDGSIG